jgi:hypothetical protein
MTILLIIAGALLLVVLTFAATVWAVANGVLEVSLTRRRSGEPRELHLFRWGFVFHGGDIQDFYVELKAAK